MDDVTAPPQDVRPITIGPRGGPESIDSYPVVEPFGDYRDVVTRQVIRGDKPTIVNGEPLRSWLRRRTRRWWE